MPSAKAARRAVRKRQINAPLRSRAKTFVTRARRSMASNDLETAEQAVHNAVVALDKAAQKGAIHANNAARRKSRIMKQFDKAKNAELS